MAQVDHKQIPRHLQSSREQQTVTLENWRKLLQDLLKQNEQLSSMNNVLKKQNENVQRELQVEKIENAKKSGIVAVLQRRLLANNLPVVDALLDGEGYHEAITPEQIKTILQDNVKMQETIDKMENGKWVHNIIKEASQLKLKVNSLQERLQQVEWERDSAMETLKNSESKSKQQIRALLMEARRVQTLENHTSRLCRAWDLSEDHVNEETRQLKAQLSNTVDACSRLSTLIGPGSGDTRELELLRSRVTQLEKTLRERDQSIAALKETYQIVLRYNQQWQAYNEQRDQFVSQRTVLQDQFARAAIIKLQALQEQVLAQSQAAPKVDALAGAADASSGVAASPARLATPRVPSTVASLATPRVPSSVGGLFTTGMSATTGLVSSRLPHVVGFATPEGPMPRMHVAGGLNTPVSSRPTLAPTVNKVTSSASGGTPVSLLPAAAEPVARSVTSSASPCPGAVDLYKAKFEEEAQSKAQLRDQLAASEERVTLLNNTLQQLQAATAGGSQAVVVDLQRKLSEAQRQKAEQNSHVRELQDELDVTKALLEQRQVAAMAQLRSQRQIKPAVEVVESGEDETDSSMVPLSDEGLGDSATS